MRFFRKCWQNFVAIMPAVLWSYVPLWIDICNTYYGKNVMRSRPSIPFCIFTYSVILSTQFKEWLGGVTRWSILKYHIKTAVSCCVPTNVPIFEYFPLFFVVRFHFPMEKVVLNTFSLSNCLPKFPYICWNWLLFFSIRQDG